MDKYQNQYRITSFRLKEWDYSNNAAYFITICTENRAPYFGDIIEGNMQLNAIGKIAETYWMEIPDHFPFIELGNFIIMPNHMHGILIINKPATSPVETRLIASPPKQQTPKQQPPQSPQPPQQSTNPQNPPPGGITGANNPMLHQNISRIIRWYKGRCTYEARKIHADFGWQSKFHDHIIRNSKSFTRIQNYIANNPAN